MFWPNISKDIKDTRLRCSSCDRTTPSQANLPPVDPIAPEFPFQHICADYLDFGGHSYGIIVDRFSNWLQIYAGKGGSYIFIKTLRQMIENFNIPESITTDGGKQYTADETQRFLKQYGISHRLCSVGNPHANSRAELGVKSAKRILRENVGVNGKLDTVKMSQALFTHRNTPDIDTGLSPAEMLLGRKLHGFLPHKRTANPLKSADDLSENWKRVAEWRELALAKRSSRNHEKWSRNIKDLPDIPLGTNVAVQNQLGNSPKRWDKRGMVVESLPYQQYKVKMDGTGRLTLRNRKFLRPFTPLFKAPGLPLFTPRWESSPLPPSSPLETSPSKGPGESSMPTSPPPAPNSSRKPGEDQGSTPTPPSPQASRSTSTEPVSGNQISPPRQMEPASPSHSPSTPRRQTFITPRELPLVQEQKKNRETEQLKGFNKKGLTEGPVLLPKLRTRK